MKKLVTLAALLPILIFSQQNTVGTLIIKQPNEVTIVTTDNEVIIEVSGQKDKPDYHYLLKVEKETNSYTQEIISNWSFSFPISEKDASATKQHINISPSFSFGFINEINAEPNLNINMGSSMEFGLDNLISWSYAPTRGSALSVGLGINWRHYRMTGYTRFIKEDNRVALGYYPENSNIDFSRIRVFSITVPLLYSQSIGKNYAFSIGPVISFNTSASLKTRYKENQTNVKIKIVDKHIKQTPVTIDAVATLRHKGFGFYFKYSPINVLHTDFGPQFSAISAGFNLF